MDMRFGIAGPGGPPDTDSLGCGRWYEYTQAFYGGFYPGPQPLGHVGLVRPHQTPWAQIPRAVAENPGHTWLLGNEPNNGGQDNVEPEHFADWFAQASQIIKSTDPSAQIAAPGVLNWARYGGNLTGVEWSTRFLNRYRSVYGQPAIDIWTLHTYGMGGAPSEDATGDAVDCQRCAYDIAGSGLGPIPLWVTEFGAVNFGGDWARLEAYTNDYTNWLKYNGATYGYQAWFLFAARATDGIASYAVYANGDLTPCGQRYAEYATGAR